MRDPRVAADLDQQGVVRRASGRRRRAAVHEHFRHERIEHIQVDRCRVKAGTAVDLDLRDRPEAPINLRSVHGRRRHGSDGDHVRGVGAVERESVVASGHTRHSEGVVELAERCGIDFKPVAAVGVYEPHVFEIDVPDLFAIIDSDSVARISGVVDHPAVITEGRRDGQRVARIA